MPEAHSPALKAFLQADIKVMDDLRRYTV